MLTALVGVGVVLARHHKAAWISLSCVAGLLLIAGGIAIVNVQSQWWPQLGNLVGMEDVSVDGDLADAKSQTGRDLPSSGRVIQASIPAAKSGVSARDAVVWLPPAWFQDPRPELPVIMMYHGTPGTPGQVLGITQNALEGYAKTHKGVAPIAVNPDINGDINADTECVDGAQGRWNTYLSEDVVEWTKTELASSSDPEMWSTMGLSEGGYCALMLAFGHTDTFNTAVPASGYNVPSAQAAPIFAAGNETSGTQEYTVTNIIDSHDLAEMAIFGGIGTAGAEPPGFKDVVAAACRQEVETIYRVFDGLGDESQVWSPTFEASIAWLGTRLGISKEPVPPPPVAKTCNLNGSDR